MSDIKVLCECEDHGTFHADLELNSVVLNMSQLVAPFYETSLWVFIDGEAFDPEHYTSEITECVKVFKVRRDAFLAEEKNRCEQMLIEQEQHRKSICARLKGDLAMKRTMALVEATLDLDRQMAKVKKAALDALWCDLIEELNANVFAPFPEIQVVNFNGVICGTQCLRVEVSEPNVQRLRIAKEYCPAKYTSILEWLQGCKFVSRAVRLAFENKPCWYGEYYITRGER